MIRTLLVAVDGSEPGQRALRWARDLARAVHARIVAVHAVGLLDPSVDPPEPTAPRRQEIEARFTRDWCADLRDGELDVVYRCVDGEPADVILRTARDEAVDLIVVGARGTGRALPPFLGSTSQQVVQLAPCPVVVCSHPRRGRASSLPTEPHEAPPGLSPL